MIPVQVQQTPPPPCYGKSWSSNAVECRGGKDEGYVNPVTKTNIRNECRWYQSCASTTAADKMKQAQPSQPLAPVPTQLIPPNRLAHPLPQAPVAPVQQGPGRPVQIQPAPQHWQPPVQQYFQPPQHVPVPQYPNYMAPPHQAYYGAPMVPVPMPQPGLQIHGYLTVPEPVIDGNHWLKRLFHEVVRAMFKSALHQGSHFFDHTPITQPRPPQAP